MGGSWVASLPFQIKHEMEDLVSRALSSTRYRRTGEDDTKHLARVRDRMTLQTHILQNRLGVGVLLSEQNLHFAKLVSDKAYIIESGEMRYEGTIAELEANAEVREKYLAV